MILAKSRAIKDGKTIPNLVFKIEAFERDIIKLSKRCNIDLFGDQYPKISTSRDFRVKEINKDAGANGTEHTTQQKRTDDAEMVNDSDTSVSYEVKCYIFIKWTSERNSKNILIYDFSLLNYVLLVTG